jgi:hypothetical protein
MTVAAAQADAFFTEVIASGDVWSISDSEGFPAPKNASGRRAMPFWSKESRAAKIIATVEAYSGFEVEHVPLAKFIQNWLPGLEKDGLLAGINWSGELATGYDMDPKDVLARLKASQL